MAAASSTPTWSVWGSYKGRVTPGNLFVITPQGGWTGDMSVILTIANAQDLVEAYKMLVLEIEVWDVGKDAEATASTTEYLTLGKGDIEIDFEQTTGPTYTVKIISGYYITHKEGWGTDKEDPLIMCQVLQREAP